MAINKNGSLSGVIGPVVVYKLNGKDVVRARPRKHKKSKASRDAAKQFGMASAISAQMRRGLNNIIGGMMQPAARYRFDAMVLSWLRNSNSSTAHDFSPFDNFQFNEKSSLIDKLRIKFLIDWSQPKKIVIEIPSVIPVRDIATPPNTESIGWTLQAVSSTRGGKDSHPRISMAEIGMKYTDKTVKAQTVQMPFLMLPGELIILVLALKYFVSAGGNKIAVTDAKWLPAGIIGSHYYRGSK